MNRRVLAAAMALFLVAGCGGSPSTPPSTPGATKSQGPAATDDSMDLTSAEPGLGQGPRGRPSGAKVRVFNGYVDPIGTPVTLEIYGAAYITEAEAPLATVDFGAFSEPFDPTVMDEAGNGFLSAYAKGETGNGNSIMSTSLTLKGGEGITIVIVRGDVALSTGRAGGMWTTHFDPSAPGAQEEASPAPGKARVRVSAAGLDNVLPETDDSWEVSFGDGCARDIGASESGHSLVSPGTTGVDYDLAPGTYTFSIHPQKEATATPDCSRGAILDGVPVKVEAGRSYVLPIYAASPTDIRATLLPRQMP